MTAELISNLKRPALYDHPTNDFSVLETHISWVLLTGDYVYKIKKPMNFGFLDFTTLDKRKFYCDEEVRLNRRLAPDIYLDTIAIYGSTESPRFVADGNPPIEYAVRMRQFDPSSVLTQAQHPAKELSRLLTQVMVAVARFHETGCAVATLDQPFGSADAILAPVVQNFEQIQPLLQDAADLVLLEQIRTWSLKEHERLAPLMNERKHDGKVRECHGDMHFGNIAVVNQAPLVFDCIEFNEEFRWIDVINDVAFLLMDLDDRGESGLGCQLLNVYLEETGDYAGVALLNYYKAYRAMVRCKVALFTLGAPGLSDAARAELAAKAHGYLELGVGYTGAAKPFLCLTQGRSGSGKTTVSSHLLQRVSAIRVRSDVERKRLAGLTPLAKSGSAKDEGIYTAELTSLTYQRLLDLADALLDVGHSVIVDATFLKQAQRKPFLELASRRHIKTQIAACQVDEHVARQRLDERKKQGKDAAEADFAIMQAQKAAEEDFDSAEQGLATVIHTNQDDEMQADIEKLLGKL
ncbi:MAG: AAA family ATPase [Hahellaceae bacterium]|nr:AAA family ATPase [Hahellaceae bacterium]